MSSELQEYILLPERGLEVREEDPLEATDFMMSLGVASDAEEPMEVGLSLVPEAPPLRVIDSVHEDGPKLVELSEESAHALRQQHPGMRLERVRYYDLAVSSLPDPSPPAGASGRPSITLQILEGNSSSPIRGIPVTAYTDFDNRVGDEATTDGSGEVVLTLGGQQVTVERLFVRPPRSGFWGAYRENQRITSGDTIRLDPIDLTVPDVVRHFYPEGGVGGGDGAGIRVAVIDAGVSHPDLNVSHGENTVRGEARNDWSDNGLGHGTHVAGIIAANGTSPAGITGLAPSVELYCYRVAAAGQRSASNYAIVKALIYAMDADCDLINLSLGISGPDDVVRDAVDDARDEGALVMAATGNDARGPVRYPAAYPAVAAVSAMGREGTFPTDALEESDVAAPRGHDSADFLAGFTNTGSAVDVCEPGVGVVSTVPGGHAPMSGTSMACPVAVGLAARFLSTDTQFQGMSRNRARSDYVARQLFQRTKRLGFGFDGEGFGQLRL